LIAAQSANFDIQNPAVRLGDDKGREPKRHQGASQP
jgi:hypothetical protein